MSTIGDEDSSRASTPFRGFTESEIEITNPLGGINLDDSDYEIDFRPTISETASTSTVKQEATKMV